MLIRQIALYSKSTKVTVQELARVSAALQKQVTRDFTPIWHIRATVDAFESEEDVPQGYWKVSVMDIIPASGAAGFHLDEQGQPYADVLWSKDWSLTASHEVLEMLADPFGRQIATGPSPKPGQGRVSFLVEVCDPCEAAKYAYTINTGSSHEVLVSDFYTPDYFNSQSSPGTLYSFRGNLTAPLQVLNGGYLSWFNPADKHLWQLFGPASMGHFVDLGPGTLSREVSDRGARTHRSELTKSLGQELAAVGSSGAGLTASAGDCNLRVDFGTGNLVGTEGQQTTVIIKNSSDSALFLSISYNGVSIGSNTKSATFTIAKGGTPLDFVYGAPLPGDLLTLVDPCGTVLDMFPNNLAEPLRQETVVG